MNIISTFIHLKSELDSWLETLDIMSNPEEVEALRISRREKGLIPYKNLLKKLNIKSS